jgi:hypothetical protein
MFFFLELKVELSIFVFLQFLWLFEQLVLFYIFLVKLVGMAICNHEEYRNHFEELQQRIGKIEVTDLREV